MNCGGSSSQQFPKKPYGIELRDSSGENSVNAPLLGMPSESDWVLNATYNDKTLIREALTYDLNRQISSVYTPRYRYCEVVLNGSYNGLYILFEKIKRDKKPHRHRQPQKNRRRGRRPDGRLYL